MDTALEEQATLVASFIYDKVLGKLVFLSLPILLFGVVILIFEFLQYLQGFTPKQKRIAL